VSSQGDRPRHDRAAGQHGSGLRAADKRVNMAGAHCVCDGEVYGTNEVLRRRVKDSVILCSLGVYRYAWAFSKRMSRGTGCVNCARPGLWGSPSGNRGALPGNIQYSTRNNQCPSGLSPWLGCRLDAWHGCSFTPTTAERSDIDP